MHIYTRCFFIFFSIFSSFWWYILAWDISIYDRIRAQNSAYLVDASHASAEKSNTLPLCVRPEDVKIKIYMYHYVRPSHREIPGSTVWNNSVTPEQFDTHMSYVHNLVETGKTHVWWMSELQERQESWCYPHTNIAIFTADDGRWDNRAYLTPIAKKYGIKFTLWLVYEKIAPSNQHYDPFMNYDDIKQSLDSWIIEIQAHSMSHADLQTLSFDQQAYEICHSKWYLEQLFWKEINTFIIPYGRTTSYVPYISKYCGYTYSLWTQYGILRHESFSSHPFHLERIRADRTLSAEHLFDVQ